MRTFAILLLRTLLLGAVPAAVAQEPDPPPAADAVGAERAVWPEDALSDGDASAAARAALPFTPAQIERLGQLLRQTRAAQARARGPAPEGRVRRIRLDAPDAGEVPEIAVRAGWVTVVGFSDRTGAPWPIESVSVDEAFLGGGAAPDGADGGHLLYLAPRERFVTGNAAVKLRGRPMPVMLSLADLDGTVDHRVEVRHPAAGPNADPAALVRPGGWHAGSDLLLGLLSGRIPSDADPVRVGGLGIGARAWRRGDALLLVTTADLLSPGPWAAERGTDGRWAYRLPETPYAWLASDGRRVRASFTGRSTPE